MRLIAPFGFYGWGNIGDESTLQGYAQFLRDSGFRIRSWVACRDPAHCRRAEPAFRYYHAEAPRSIRRRFAWETADAMVVPGGTPIMDVLGEWPLSELTPIVRRAVAARKPIAFIGSGIEPLRQEGSRARFAVEIAPHVSAWTVRSERDRVRLIEFGVPPHTITPAADLAWALEPATSDYGRRRLAALGLEPDAFLVGVNVNIEEFVRAEQPQLLSKLAALLDHLIATHGAHVLFLCNEVRSGETFDLAAAREVISSMGQSSRTTIFPNEYLLPQEMKSLVACCRLTISTRYHFCLFSAMQAVPFLAIQRSGKVTDLCEDLQWEFGVSPKAMELDRLVALMEQMETHRPRLVTQLEQALPRMRTRSRQNTVALAVLRQCLGKAPA